MFGNCDPVVSPYVYAYTHTQMESILAPLASKKKANKDLTVENVKIFNLDRLAPSSYFA